MHEYPKSTIFAIIVEYTSISRGKYIFVMRLLLPTSTADAAEILWVKKFQGRSATDRKIMKGTPREGTLSIVSNT